MSGSVTTGSSASGLRVPSMADPLGAGGSDRSSVRPAPEHRQGFREPAPRVAAPRRPRPRRRPR
ncbi:hypothetical protein [Ornithinimicrobium kibberense]|uniref:hypothetical protein n=1 Tax=Ornithinimicrobium kibberense TaxID=282060 RepID=UPI00360DC40C